MKQVNYRLSDEEYDAVKLIADTINKSVPIVLKEAALKELARQRKENAFILYASKKIGFKHAWKLSGLSFSEFQQEIIARNIEPTISDELGEKMVELALTLKVEDLFPQKPKKS
jgi:predicted HTH domain antitoxin